MKRKLALNPGSFHLLGIRTVAEVKNSLENYRIFMPQGFFFYQTSPPYRYTYLINSACYASIRDIENVLVDAVHQKNV